MGQIEDILNKDEELEKRDILRYLITISNGLQYAYDNGFHH